MKKTVIIALIIVSVLALSLGLAGCRYYGEKDPTAAEVEAVNGGTVKGQTLEIVVDAGTESIDLSNKIATVSDAPWQLFRDNACSNEITDKKIPGEGYSLINGDNSYYVSVKSLDGSANATYLLLVHKQYSVTARVLNDAGEQVSSEVVLSHTAYEPKFESDIPMGYAFDGWSASDPNWNTDGIIRQDTDFTAVILPKSYSVRYSLKEGESLPEGAHTSLRVTFDDEFTLAVPVNADASLYFAGWRSAYDEELMITDASGKSLAPWSRDAYLVVVAVWTTEAPADPGTTEPGTEEPDADPDISLPEDPGADAGA